MRPRFTPWAVMSAIFAGGLPFGQIANNPFNQPYQRTSKARHGQYPEGKPTGTGSKAPSHFERKRKAAPSQAASHHHKRWAKRERNRKRRARGAYIPKGHLTIFKSGVQVTLIPDGKYSPTQARAIQSARDRAKSMFVASG